MSRKARYFYFWMLILWSMSYEQHSDSPRTETKLFSYTAASVTISSNTISLSCIKRNTLSDKVTFGSLMRSDVDCFLCTVTCAYLKWLVYSLREIIQYQVSKSDFVNSTEQNMVWDLHILLVLSMRKMSTFILNILHL